MNNKKSQTGGGHSGPRGRRINLPNWMKNQAKRGNGTLNIAFLKTKCFSIRVTIKLSFGFFCFFCLVKGHFRLLGPKSACWMAKMATYRKIEGIPSFHQDMGEIWSNWVGSIWAPTSSQAPSYASESETTTYRLTYSLTGVKCRATSVAKKVLYY